MARVTFGAGCFWGVEATFRRVKGVTATAVGYMGGTTPNPTYEEVCTDRTGHAEVVQVEYDPAQVTFEQLLEVFWECHNPSASGGRWPESGRQYRSAIFYETADQRDAALKSKAALQASGRYSQPIVTEVAPAEVFYRAEEYHQRYHEKGGESCHL